MYGKNGNFSGFWRCTLYSLECCNFTMSCTAVMKLFVQNVSQVGSGLKTGGASSTWRPTAKLAAVLNLEQNECNIKVVLCICKYKSFFPS